ncbi:uncharacterized protein B0H18DRAFT_329171 [Fomitopsis serialis]|uniref:uncharacterized protein n=1 Tax=Fomitopsis serialis TaxID=139415 RepID=UPI002007B08C|nr:uncharacterized protein B0H18DRAFT_329171 [Neoantrodia serialis]KAH9936670.1 hypothetical protein B0H18DRAFT_329171 [Neoantrodia serialis]
MDVNTSTTRQVRPDSPSQTLQTIHDDITYHTQCISDLKARLNTFVPIARLPPEVLSEVFLQTVAARTTYDARIGRQGALHPYHWLRATQVCRHWRAVALSCTPLWSHLKVTARCGSLPIPLFLEWARKAPLVVSVVWDSMDADRRFRPGYSVEGQNRVANLILSHLPRIGGLSFTLLGLLPDYADVLDRLGGSAPLLESLSIHCEHESVSPDKALRLMHRLETTNLRRLHLYTVPLEWGTIVLPTLTHLTLGNNPDSDRLLKRKATGTVQDLLTALAHMSLLQELVIDYGVLLSPPGPNTAALPAPSIHAFLPHLRRLHISEGAVNNLFLLSYMDTPSLAALRTSGSQALQHEFCAALASKMHSLGRPLTLVVELFRYAARVRGYTQIVHVDDGAMDQPDLYPQRSGTSPSFDVRFWDSDGHDGGLDMFTTFCELSPIHDVDSLFLINFPLLHGHHVWTATSQHMTKVTQLYLRPPKDHDVVPQWVLLQKDRDDPVVHRRDDEAFALGYPFPQLGLLTLDGVCFRNPGSPSGEDTAGCITTLVKVLIERREAGAEIERLRILNPKNMEPKDLERLKEVVREVECNGPLL